MRTRVFYMYQQYLLMGNNRSLAKLSSSGQSPSLSTLKRWSARYGWAALAALHEELIAQRMAADLVEKLSARARSDTDLISIAKSSFYERAALDVTNAALSKKDRRRILQPSVLDFIRLIKLERDLKTSR